MQPLSGNQPSDLLTSLMNKSFVLQILFKYILTWKCASRHNGVHFFNISTSKSGPRLRWFCTFWIGNMLRATTACTFSTSQLVKVVRSWCVLYMLTSKCASRHNGVQFFISHLASWLRTRRFSEPTFRPSRATNLSYLFAHLHLLSSGSFSSTLLSSNLSLLSASALLCFSSVHIVGSLTSKLPSINKLYIYFIPMVVIFLYIYIDIYTRILPDLPTEWVTCWTFFSCCGRRHAAVGGQCLTTAPANAGGGGDESDAT